MANKDETKLKASDHEQYYTYGIICLILPAVGLILGIVFMTKDSRLDKKLGEHLLALSILASIMWFILWYALTTLYLLTA